MILVVDFIGTRNKHICGTHFSEDVAHEVVVEVMLHLVTAHELMTGRQVVFYNLWG